MLCVHWWLVKWILVNVLFWFYLVKPGYSARILGVFHILSKSHFNFHEEIMWNLAESGHQVTMISPFPLSQPHKNMTIINSDVGRKIDTKLMASAMSIENHWFINFLNGIFYWSVPDCYHIMTMEEVKNLTKDYDIMFLEIFYLYQCFLPLAKKLDIQVIATLAHRSNYNLDYIAGNSRNPAVFPKENTFLNREMSFLERLLNSLEDILYKAIDFVENKKLESFLEELTEFPKEHNASISLILSNNHDIFLPRATTNMVINIGGIGLKSKILNPLPQDLENFINEAKHGVILFSLGTLFNSDIFPPEIITTIKIDFAKIPQRIIWKWDHDIEGISDNVLIKKWIPQKEVLAHKNVLAFMSHCGLNSLYESIYFGKPLILLPLFSDQRGNAGIISSLGVGIYVDLLKLQEMELVDAVKEVINDPEYRKNMEKLSKRFKDDPMTPAQKVVYWTEYVLRHKGAQHLQWVGADMPSYQYFLVDIISFVTISFVLSIFLLYLSVKCISALLSTFISKA